MPLQLHASHLLHCSGPRLCKGASDAVDCRVGRFKAIREAEMIFEQDPPVLPVAWEKINDVWFNYVKGHNPKDYFGIYDCVRFDTFWLDK